MPEQAPAPSATGRAASKGAAATATAAIEPAATELGVLADMFRIPPFVPAERLSELNVWIGGGDTTTNLHYDASHNWLFVLAGLKEVTLFPPSETPSVRAHPACGASANHSDLSTKEAKALAVAAAERGAMTVMVAAGQALFIPEGWWHQVSSAPATVAVNVWFDGTRAAICGEDAAHMRQYYLRSLLVSLLADEKARLLADPVVDQPGSSPLKEPSLAGFKDGGTVVDGHGGEGAAGVAAEGLPAAACVRGVKRRRRGDANTATTNDKAVGASKAETATTATIPDLQRRLCGANSLADLGWLPELARTDPSGFQTLLGALSPADCERLAGVWEREPAGSPEALAFDAALQGSGRGEGGGGSGGEGG
ncbi:unnamed protein product, partial [Phaeothamnion confervicola]